MEKKASRAEEAIAKRIWNAAPRGRPIPAAVRKALAEVGLGAFEQDVAALSRRVLTLTPLDAKGAPVGAPRLGGAPDLPLKVGWPEREGQLLTFVLQVSVAETLLGLFVGQRAATGEVEHQVLAINPSSLQRRPIPTRAVWREARLGLLDNVPLEAAEGWALPPVDSDQFVALVSRHPELHTKQAAYQAAAEALVPSGQSHAHGFAAQPALERAHKKAAPLFSVTSNARARLDLGGTLDVLSPANARFGRGVVSGTVAVLLPA